MNLALKKREYELISAEVSIQSGPPKCLSQVQSIIDSGTALSCLLAGIANLVKALLIHQLLAVVKIPIIL